MVCDHKKEEGSPKDKQRYGKAGEDIAEDQTGFSYSMAAFASSADLAQREMTGDDCGQGNDKRGYERND